uniref:coiled-coil domain-containing protein 106-like n=1 Tax=Epinephelus lanceolatus TaxID=310571 RepID=UPI00144620F5|nr:coiled-coil domain-containing protein 106-like [Epinephelus lanceolatus]
MSQTQTRRGKKKEENKKKTLPVENNLKEVESDIEVEEVRGGSCGTMEKFKSDLNQLKGENRLLKEEIRLLKEENRLLKQERDLLKEKSRSSEAGSQKRSHDLGESSDSSEPESSFETKKAAKKRRRKPASSSSSDEDSPKKKPKKASFGKRVSSPEDVVHRYKKLVRMYKRTRSIPETCRAFDLDRNTIAGTAVIADVLIAGEGGGWGELPIIAEKQSLASFAKVCKAFLDANPTLKEKVDKMRKANELLTIKYKFQK